MGVFTLLFQHHPNAQYKILHLLGSLHSYQGIKKDVIYAVVCLFLRRISSIYLIYLSLVKKLTSSQVVVDEYNTYAPHAGFVDYGILCMQMQPFFIPLPPAQSCMYGPQCISTILFSNLRFGFCSILCTNFLIPYWIIMKTVIHC